MVIIIILIAIVVIGVVWGVLDGKYNYGDNVPVLGVLSGVCFAVLLALSIMSIIVHSPTFVLKTQYEITETISLLQSKKTILESYHLVVEGDNTVFTSNITLEVVSTAEYYQMVNDYNKEAYDFKVDIKEKQLYAKDVWVNWLCCPACLSVSDETLNSLTYTTGK